MGFFIFIYTLMDKFTDYEKRKESQRVFKIKATLELSINAQSEGEASYLADSILAGTENIDTFFIESVNENTSIEK
jgi:hypothetical protein